MYSVKKYSDSTQLILKTQFKPYDMVLIVSLVSFSRGYNEYTLHKQCVVGRLQAGTAIFGFSLGWNWQKIILLFWAISYIKSQGPLMHQNRPKTPVYDDNDIVIVPPRLYDSVIVWCPTRRRRNDFMISTNTMSFAFHPRSKLYRDAA